MAVGSSAASPAKLNGAEVVGLTEVAVQAEVVGPTEVAVQAVVVAGAEVPELPKYCHQCHQRTEGVFATCKKQKKGKFCSTKFCQRCLWNRYREKAEEITVLDNWYCPKCRGICNCCMCRKKQGPNSSGKVPTADASGSSVPDLLGAEGPQNLDVDRSIRGLSVDLKDDVASNNPAIVLLEGQTSSSMSNQDKKKRKRVKPRKEQNPEIVLPQGTELTSIAGANIPPEDIGHALQFLDFCAYFGELLELKEREPEDILDELVLGGRACLAKRSLSVHFHKLLLNFLKKDLEKISSVTPQSGKNSWLHDIWRLASRSSFKPHTLNLEQLCTEDGYVSSNFSGKLRILNFLCDESLLSNKIRSWMKKREVLAATCKKKQDKLKIEDELAKAIGPEADTETEGEQRSNVLRTEPIHLGNSGRICWRLNWCSDNSNLFIQEVGSSDGSPEKWFIYNEEEEKKMEKYILTSRKRGKTRKVVVDDLSNNTEEDEDPIVDPMSNNEP